MDRNRFREEMKASTNEELVGALNRQVGNNGWSSSRGAYLAALHKELEARDFETSLVITGNSLSIKYKVEMVGTVLFPMLDMKKLEDEISDAWDKSLVSNRMIDERCQISDLELIKELSDSGVKLSANHSCEHLFKSEAFFIFLELELRQADTESFLLLLKSNDLTHFIELIPIARAVNEVMGYH